MAERARVKSSRAALLLMTASFFGCTAEVKGGGGVPGAELVVRWTVDGSDAVSVCSDIAVERWVVEARDGETIETVEVDCSEGFTTEDLLADLPSGSYTITVVGIGAGGAEIGRSFASEVVYSGSELIVDVPLFTSIDVYWNINGTVDGTALGTSWDNCDEVDAVSALITVDGAEPIEADCHSDGNMNITLTGLSIGAHTVKVKLIDADGNELTTEAEATFSTDENGAEFVAEFFWDSFFEPTQSNVIGSYWFQTLFEGGGCDSTSPPVDNQLALLELDGTTVDGAVVCDGDLLADPADCPLANGAEIYPCTDGDQVMPDLTWGAYQVVLQGTVATSLDEDDICWETSADDGHAIEVLVGAGSENPVDVIDLARFSTAGYCTP